jgi:hypothetical protein
MATAVAPEGSPAQTRLKRPQIAAKRTTRIITAPSLNP